MEEQELNSLLVKQTLNRIFKMAQPQISDEMTEMLVEVRGEAHV